MKSLSLLILGLFAALFVGLAGASESDDLVETVDTVGDAIGAIDTVMDGAELLEEQLKDPTNTTLLTDNLVDMVTENIADYAIGAVYFELFSAFVVAFSPFIVALVAIISRFF